MSHRRNLLRSPVAGRHRTRKANSPKHLRVALRSRLSGAVAQTSHGQMVNRLRRTELVYGTRYQRGHRGPWGVA